MHACFDKVYLIGVKLYSNFVYPSHEGGNYQTQTNKQTKKQKEKLNVGSSTRVKNGKQLLSISKFSVYIDEKTIS